VLSSCEFDRFDTARFFPSTTREAHPAASCNFDGWTKELTVVLNWRYYWLHGGGACVFERKSFVEQNTITVENYERFFNYLHTYRVDGAWLHSV
jgi:hypothetical protein